MCVDVRLVRVCLSIWFGCFFLFLVVFPFGPPVLSEPGRGRRRRRCRLLLLFALVSLRCSVKLDSSARVRVWLAWVLWRRSRAWRVNLYLLSFACRCDCTFTQEVPIEVQVRSWVLWVNLGVARRLLGYLHPSLFLSLFSLASSCIHVDIDACTSADCVLDTFR